MVLPPRLTRYRLLCHLNWMETSAKHLLCLSSGSASFGGKFEGKLCHNAARRLIQTLLLLPVFGGCTATILRGLTYPKILCVPEKEKKERKWRHRVA